jgi:hypothetical protein
MVEVSASHHIMSLMGHAEPLWHISNADQHCLARSVYAISSSCTAVLLASSGTGDDLLRSQPTLRGALWSPTTTAACTTGALLHNVKSNPSEARWDDAPAPLDWHQLSTQHGLRSFLAVPIGLLGGPSAALGVLTVACSEPYHLGGSAWESALQTLSLGLLSSLQQQPLRQFVEVLEAAGRRRSTRQFAGLLLSGVAQLLGHACQLPVSCRLALVSRDQRHALVFELPEGAASSHAARKQPEAAGAAATVTQLSTTNTLLLGCIGSGRRARFVSDCMTYLQSCSEPVADLFLGSAAPLASLVVLPLVLPGRCTGGIYFCRATPTDFGSHKAALMAVTEVVEMQVGGGPCMLLSTCLGGL